MHPILCPRRGPSGHPPPGALQNALRAQRLKKFKIAPRDWNFQSRLKFSSEPPANPLIFVGNSEGPGLKISIEIDFFNRDWKNYNRDWFFSIFGPLGWGAPGLLKGRLKGYLKGSGGAPTMRSPQRMASEESHLAKLSYIFLKAKNKKSLASPERPVRYHARRNSVRSCSWGFKPDTDTDS